MRFLPVIFCFIVAAAGFYYAFYSTAATRLVEVEAAAANARRVRLRRLNGCMMIAMGAVLFLCFSALDQKWSPALIALLLMASMLLLFGVGFLALVDLRMTNHLRRTLRDKLIARDQLAARDQTAQPKKERDEE